MKSYHEKNLTKYEKKILGEKIQNYTLEEIDTFENKIRFPEFLLNDLCESK